MTGTGDSPEACRVAINYRKLNQQTVFHNYPMPRIERLLRVVKCHKVMSGLDLTSGYHQIPIKEQDIPKTPFVFPYGSCTFKRMSFDLSPAPSTFQKLMYQVLQPVLRKYVLV